MVINLRMPGQYFDEESNEFYNYFRDYDASLGRYVQSDPIGLVSGLNPFQYAFANPVAYIDPDGRLPLFVIFPLVTGIVNASLDAMSAAACGNNQWQDVASAFGRGFLSSAVGGLVGIGASIVPGVGPVVAGVAAGGASNLVSQFLGGRQFSAGELAYSAALGGGAGKLASKLIPFRGGRGMEPSLTLNRTQSDFGMNSYRAVGQIATAAFVGGYAGPRGLFDSLAIGNCECSE